MLGTRQGRRTALAVFGLSLALMVAACSSGTRKSGPSTRPTTPSSSALARSTSSSPRTSAKPTPRRTTKPKPKPKPRTSAPKPTHRTKHQTRLRGTVTSKVYAVGDSVMVDARPSLLHDIDGIHVDADVSRQAGAGVDVVRNLKANGNLPKTVVFGLGTNGTFPRSQLDELVSLTRGRHLVVVTTHCGYCGWTSSNNQMVRANCTANRHCYVADFEARAQRNPQWFASDSVHMPPGGPGAQAYGEVVAATLCRAGLASGC